MMAKSFLRQSKMKLMQHSRLLEKSAQLTPLTSPIRLEIIWPGVFSIGWHHRRWWKLDPTYSCSWISINYLHCWCFLLCWTQLSIRATYAQSKNKWQNLLVTVKLTTQLLVSKLKLFSIPTWYLCRMLVSSIIGKPGSSLMCKHFWSKRRCKKNLFS